MNTVKPASSSCCGSYAILTVTSQLWCCCLRPINAGYPLLSNRSEEPASISVLSFSDKDHSVCSSLRRNRSEERRVGKECRYRWSRDNENINMQMHGGKLN